VIDTCHPLNIMFDAWLVFAKEAKLDMKSALSAISRYIVRISYYIVLHYIA